jgi:hypothetical protein
LLFRELSSRNTEEVLQVERLRVQNPLKKLGGGLKDKPLCEHCGRPVRVISQDDIEDEVLCPSCASELKTLEAEEYESAR